MEQLRRHIADRIALASRCADESGDKSCKITSVTAHVTAERRKWTHRVRILDLHVTTGPLSDQEDACPPAPPELQVGILGSHLAHSYLVEADVLKLGVDSLDIDIEWRSAAPTAGSGAGRKSRPRISYVVRIASPASEREIVRLAVLAEKSCSALGCLRGVQTILGVVEHRSTAVSVGVSYAVPTEGGAYRAAGRDLPLSA